MNQTVSNTAADTPTARPHRSALLVVALGVVFGDIGTSPLYALKECFSAGNPHAVSPTAANVLGVLSLIIWSLLLIVSAKYLTFVMRANNLGEGGILALLALVVPEKAGRKGRRNHAVLISLGIFGSALLYGDGIITPSISVLSAVEGLSVATPQFQPYIPAITVGILIALFSFQRLGTGGVGAVFGPVMLVWFVSLALLGLRAISNNPGVFLALSPVYGFEFFLRNGWHGFLVLGAVFLAVTGAEALYADMGHFGRRPICVAWLAIVFPGLVLNYLGQGALLLQDPTAAANPFYRLAPSWAVIPMVVLATCAAVIASQALISGAFSLTMQAIQMGLCPRMKIDHTSSVKRGQIYVPYINWALMLACIGLVLGFGSSSNLAAAYGIAVTLTMLITTVLYYAIARRQWGFWAASIICGIFLVAELAFFGANLVKIFHGGWFPIVVAIVIFTLMSTWRHGRRVLAEKLRAASVPLQAFLTDVRESPPVRVHGTAVFLSSNPEGTPIALLHNLKHNRILHERVVIMTIVTDDIPHVAADRRVAIEQLEGNFHRVVARFGFMEDPDIREVLDACRTRELEIDPMKSTFFLSRETLIFGKRPRMPRWRGRLFELMARNAQRPTAFFRLPANRVIELGMQVEI